MKVAVERRKVELQERVALFSLFWLAAANLVGVWLAALLLWPRLGDVSAFFGYGRWMPLHMDWHLYGWCALPLLGLIAVRIWKNVEGGEINCSQAFWLWSAALMVGGVSWLMGEATGKPFLNWSGYARDVFTLALVGVWLLVAVGWWRKRQQPEVKRAEAYSDLLLVAGLAFVPVSLFLVSTATVYPPVNPNSGGATGHSLLASTLGIVFIMGLLPNWGLGLKAGKGKSRATPAYWIVFSLSVLVYLLIGHGNASNRNLDQILGLGSLVIWPFLLFWLWKRYKWDESSSLWRGAFFVWWGLLAVSGWLFFLPNTLTIVKFTNAMVAHAHLAMAGMVTALNMVILTELGSNYAVRSVVSEAKASVAWNIALAVFVVVLAVQGAREGVTPGSLFLFDGIAQLAYVLRFVAGLVMFACSVIWIRSLWKMVN